MREKLNQLNRTGTGVETSQRLIEAGRVARAPLRYFDLFALDAAVPDSEQSLGRRDGQRPDDANAEELGVGVIPDALGELGILDLPDFVGIAACGAAEFVG